MREFDDRQGRITQPIEPVRPVVESHDHVAVERRSHMSGGAVAALVLAAVAAAIAGTMLVMSARQSSNDNALQPDRSRAADTQQAVPQPPATLQPPATPQQPGAPQPPVAATPPGRPTAPPAATPPPSEPPPNATAAAPTSAQLEVNVSSKLLDDPELGSSPIEVTVSGGTATLTGQVATQELKARAGGLAKSVKGISKVVNEIEVKPE